MNNVKEILYLGWLGQGNTGDDILFELFKRLFYRFCKSSSNIQFNITPFIPFNEMQIDIEKYNLIVLGGGSLLNLKYWLAFCNQIQKLGKPIVTWGTGYDGYFTNKNINNLHVPPNDDDPTLFSDTFQSMKYVSVRGPYTKQYLTSLGIDPSSIDVIGDPALCYGDAWDIGIDGNTGVKSKLVLINWGTASNKVFGSDEQRMEKELVQVIQSLLKRSYQVLIYPIWVDDIEPVKRLGQKVVHPNCKILTSVLDGTLLYKLISKSYMTINMKLHANILSASANRPFISLAYRGKCYEFAEIVDCLDYVDKFDIATASSILEKVNRIENSYTEVVSNITVQRNTYRDKVINSFYRIFEYV